VRSDIEVAILPDGNETSDSRVCVQTRPNARPSFGVEGGGRHACSLLVAPTASPRVARWTRESASGPCIEPCHRGTGVGQHSGEPVVIGGTAAFADLATSLVEDKR
jgi:hypothetical protein